MRSPVIEAAVNPGKLTQFHAMPPRCIMAPELTAATGLIVQSCSVAGPNGGKLSVVGPGRRRFERPRSED